MREKDSPGKDHRSFQRREAYRRMRQEANRSTGRRKLLFFLLGTGTSLLVGGGAAHWLSEERSDAQALKDHLKRLPLPEVRLHPADIKQLESQFWKEPLVVPRDYLTMSAETQRRIVGELLNGVFETMKASPVSIFRETTRVLEEHAGQAVSGSITPRINVPAEDVHEWFRETPDAAMNTGIRELGETWTMDLMVNGHAFAPTKMAELPFLRNRWFWALISVHELLGHYTLFRSLIELYTGRGMSLTKAIDETVQMPYHEPYAYAVQFRTHHQLLSQGVDLGDQPTSFTEGAAAFAALEAESLSWHDDRWVNAVNR